MITDQVGHSWPVPAHHVSALKALADHAGVPNNMPSGCVTVRQCPPAQEPLTIGARAAKCVDAGTDRRLQSNPPTFPSRQVASLGTSTSVGTSRSDNTIAEPIAEAPSYILTQAEVQSDDSDRPAVYKAPTIKRARSGSVGRRVSRGTVADRASSLERQTLTSMEVPANAELVAEADVAVEEGRCYETAADAGDEGDDAAGEITQRSADESVTESSLDGRSGTCPCTDFSAGKDATVLAKASKAEPVLKNVRPANLAAPFLSKSGDGTRGVAAAKERLVMSKRSSSGSSRHGSSATARVSRLREKSPNGSQVRASLPQNATSSASEINALNDAYSRLVGHPPPVALDPFARARGLA